MPTLLCWITGNRIRLLKSDTTGADAINISGLLNTNKLGNFNN